MPTIAILAIIGGLIILYYTVVPFLKKGETESLFLIEDGKDLFALVLMDIEMIVMSKRGAFIIHRYRLKKVNIHTGEVVFNVHYKKITASLLQSYATMLGCTARYAYLTSLKKDLTVFDITNGKKIADKKFFFRKGIEISDQDWTFDKDKGVLLVYDKQGIQYVINGTEITKTYSFRGDKNSGVVLNVFEGLRFNDHDNFMLHIRTSLNMSDPVGKQLQLKEIPGTKRSVIHISDFFDSNEPNINEKDSFIKPLLLRLDQQHFLVKHQLNMDDNKDEIFLSRVNFDSKEIWKLHKEDIAYTNIGDNRMEFYINRYKGQLIFTYVSNGAKEFSICCVSEETGEVIMKPKYFKNKKVN